MRKVLVAILCLVFLGACTRKDVEGQTEIPGSGLTLAVRSGDSLIAAGIPAAVYMLTGLTQNQVCEPQYFTADEKISYEELLPGEYTFFVLGNVVEEDGVYLSLSGRELKHVNLECWRYNRLPDLSCNVVKVNGSKENVTVEMVRLVGGVKVDIVNQSDFRSVELGLAYSGVNLDSIALGEYAVFPRMNGIWDVTIGEEFYLFPSSEVLRGQVIAYDENDQIYYFDFTTKNGVQRNKRLELSLTLNKESSVARSVNLVSTVDCVEKVSEL